MNAIAQFLEALSKNYYLDFLLEEPIQVLHVEPFYYTPIVYKERDYLEMDLFDIRKQNRAIIDKFKGLYSNALTEVNLNIVTSNEKQVKIFIETLIESIKVHLNTIVNDFDVTDSKSRYYSEPCYYDNKLKEALQKATNDIFKFQHERQGDTILELNNINLYVERIRISIISFLPMALFTIANAFIIELNKIKEKTLTALNDDEDSEKPVKKDQLSNNQIVVLLDRLGFFTSVDIESLSNSKQAEILNLLTGLNKQNLRQNIGNLNKKSSMLKPQQVADIEKVQQILDSLK